MHKLFNYLFSAILLTGLLFITSCGEDEVPTPAVPEITLDASSAEVYPRETVTVSGTVNAPGGINAIDVAVGADASVNLFTKTAGTETLSETFSYDYTVPVDAAAGDVIITISVVDDSNQTTDVTFTLTVKATVAISEYSATLLGGQTNATEPSFFNAIDGTTYLLGDFLNTHSMHTDILYFFGSTNQATLAAPDDSDADIAFGTGTITAAPTLNATRFVVSDLTAAQFDEILFDHEILAQSFDAGGASKANQLAVGNVLVFQLDAARGSKFGLVKVVAIEGTSGVDRSITIDTKIQL